MCVGGDGKRLAAGRGGERVFALPGNLNGGYMSQLWRRVFSLSPTLTLSFCLKLALSILTLCEKKGQQE